MLQIDNATLVKRFFLMLSIAAVLYIFGFAYFTYRANHISSSLPPLAERSLVAVFTGAQGRIGEGFDIARARKNTLLISGVHESSSLVDILNSNNIDPTLEAEVDIVIGRMARNTYENAIEADICATIRNLDSIIVVTSNYHLPRVATLMKIVSEHKIYYHAEESKKLSFIGYIKSHSDFRLILREYHKYLKLQLYYVLHHYFKIFKINDGTHEHFSNL